MIMRHKYIAMKGISSSYSRRSALKLVALLLLATHITTLRALTVEECKALRTGDVSSTALAGAKVIDSDEAWAEYVELPAVGSGAAKLITGGIYKVSSKVSSFPRVVLDGLEVVFFSDSPIQLGCPKADAGLTSVLQIQGESTVCLYNLGFMGCTTPFLTISKASSVTTNQVTLEGFATPAPLIQVLASTLVLHSSRLVNHTITTKKGSPLIQASGSIQIDVSQSTFTDINVPSNAPLVLVQYSTSTSVVAFDGSTVSGNTAGRLIYAESSQPFDASRLREEDGSILSDNDMLDVYAGAPGAKAESASKLMDIAAGRAPRLLITNSSMLNNTAVLELIALKQVHLHISKDSVFADNRGLGAPVEGSCYSSNVTLCGMSSVDHVGHPLPDCCIKLQLNESWLPAGVPAVMPASWNGSHYNSRLWAPTMDCQTRTPYVLASTLPLNTTTSSGRCGLPPGSRLVSHMIYAYNASVWVEDVQWRGNNFSYGSLLETANHTAVVLQGLLVEDNIAQTILNVTAEMVWLDKKQYQELRWQDQSQRDLNRPSDSDTFNDNTLKLANITAQIGGTAQSSPVYMKDCSFQRNKAFVGIVRSWGTRDGDWANKDKYDETSGHWYLQNSSFIANIIYDIDPQRANTPAQWLSPSVIGFIHVNATFVDVVLDSNTAGIVVNIEVSSTTAYNTTLAGNQATTGVLWYTRWATIGLIKCSVAQNSWATNKVLIYIDGVMLFLNGTNFARNQLVSQGGPTLPGTAILQGAGGSLMFVENTTFMDNQARQMVYTNDCKHVLSGLNFTSNNGTGLHMDVPAKAFESDFATTNLTRMVFEGNKAGLCGGLYVRLGSRSSVAINESIFSNNQGALGGAICFKADGADQVYPARFTVSETVVVANRADKHGGGIRAMGGWLNITSTNISRNRAVTGSGGGIFAEVLGYSFDNITLTENWALSGGGATLINSCMNLMDPTDICKCSLRDSNVESNEADGGLVPAVSRVMDGTDVGVPCGLGGGGGLCIVGPLANKSSLINTALQSNRADFGGAMYLECHTLNEDRCRVDMQLQPSRPLKLNTATRIGPTVMLSSTKALQVACAASSMPLNVLQLSPSTCPAWQHQHNTYDAVSSVLGVGTLPRRLKCLQAVEGSNQRKLVESDLQVISGDHFNVTVQLYDEDGVEVNDIPSDIVTTASVYPEDLIMVGTQPGDISAAILKEGRVNFPNIAVWPTQHDPNNSVYTITFTANSSYSKTPIVPATLRIIVPRCTLGEYQASQSHWCQQCGNLSSGNPLFSLHPQVRCEPCMPNGDCSVHTDNDQARFGMLLPKSGFFQTSFLLPQLVRCPVPDACKRNNNSALVKMLMAWKEELRLFEANNSKDGLEAWLNASAASLPVSGKAYAQKNMQFMSAQCAPGYEGLMCSSCAKGYGRYFGRCQQCLSTTINTLILLLVIIGLLAVVFFLTSGHLRKTFRRHGQASGIVGGGSGIAAPALEGQPETQTANQVAAESFDKLSHIFKVLTTFVQVNSITKGTHTVTPKLIRSFFGNMDFTSSPAAWISLDCSLRRSSYSAEQIAVARSIVMILLPAFCILLAYLGWFIFLAFMLRTKQIKREDFRAHLTSRLWLTTVQTLYFLYPMTTMSIFDVFNCDPLEPTKSTVPVEWNHWMQYKQYAASNCHGGWGSTGCDWPVWRHEKTGFWRLHYDTVCMQGGHKVLTLALGIPALIVFAFGVPAALLVVLYVRRHRLHELTTQMKFGFLYEEYKPQFGYWEAVIMARKVTLLAVTIAVPHIRTSFKEYIQVSSSILIVQVCFLLHLTFQPFQDQFLNRLETLSLMTTLINLSLFTYWLADVSKTTIIVVTTLLLLVNVSVLMYFAWNLVIHLKKLVGFVVDQGKSSNTPWWMWMTMLQQDGKTTSKHSQPQSV